MFEGCVLGGERIWTVSGHASRDKHISTLGHVTLGILNVLFFDCLARDVVLQYNFVKYSHIQKTMLKNENINILFVLCGVSV